jgi:transcriptional regulator GlxA family with amidase domain
MYAGQANMKKLHFAIIAVDGCITSAVFGPIELVEGCRRMQAAAPEIEPCAITSEILSLNGAPFLGSAGYRMPVDGALKDLPTGSVIFLPGFGLPPVSEMPALLERHAPLTKWLKRQHQAGCTIVATCTGNFLLGEADLLPGRKATTHWYYADLFRKRYPNIDLDIDTVLFEDDRVFSVGGGVCGLDAAALAVVERWVGKEVARLCTKMLALESRRPSELHFEKRQIAVHNDPLITRTVTWIRGNLHARFTMDELLRQVPTSRRNLTRRFKMETGEPLQTFIQRLRMDRAKLLLETSNLPIEQVVEQVGYQDMSAFARQFKRHTQLTPNLYRQRYRLRSTAP